ncbi:unnamed protein product [Paramecium sonneborni]|uniref:Transmembrane protein n=1 Tax=Paramecium sonneborni TaxID=65129 RepID=A0A8S1QVW6_9CILI|nr:unnamed protein product [Paramecium sonneborni]
MSLIKLILFQILEKVALSQGCFLRYQVQNSLITITQGEHIEFDILHYMIGVSLQFQIQPYSPKPLEFPYIYLQKSFILGKFFDEIIDMDLKFTNPFQELTYYALVKLNLDDQISHRMVEYTLNSKNDMTISNNTLIINSEVCYHVRQNYEFFVVTCLNQDNMLYIVIDFLPLQFRQSFLLDDIKVPSQSKVITKIKLNYIGILISKGKMENDEYISEYSQLIIFYFTIESINTFQDKLIIVMYKQYEVLKEPDDFITDFEIYKNMVFISRYKKGLSFKFLDVVWSNETLLYHPLDQVVLGIKYITEFLPNGNLFFILWTKNKILFLRVIFNQLKQLELRIIQEYPDQQFQVFEITVKTYLRYVIFLRDEDFQVMKIEIFPDSTFHFIPQFTERVSTKFVLVNEYSDLLIYHDKNYLYGLYLGNTQIEIANLNELQPPQLIIIKSKTATGIQCQDVRIYYQVVPKDVELIQLSFYIENENNMIILNYKQTDKRIQVDLDKILTGLALDIQSIKLQVQSKYQVEYSSASQPVLLYEDTQSENQLLYGDSVFFCKHYHYERDTEQKILFIKDNAISLIHCFYEEYSICKNKYRFLILDFEEVQDCHCIIRKGLMYISIISIMNQDSKQNSLTIMIIDLKKLIPDQIFLHPQDEGIIIQAITIHQKTIYIVLKENKYSLNFRDNKNVFNIYSIQIDCYKFFKFQQYQEIIDMYQTVLIPLIQYDKYNYYINIGIYMIKHIEIELVRMITIDVTKTPDQETLYLEIASSITIYLVWLTDTDKGQIKRIIQIDSNSLIQNFYNTKIDKDIQIKFVKTKTLPYFELQQIYKISLSSRYLYVYGSEVNVPACIYIYTVDQSTNWFKSLYHIIRTNDQKFPIFNSFSTIGFEGIFVNYNPMTYWLVQNKYLLINNLNQNNKESKNDVVIIEILIKTLVKKDDTKVQTFFLKLKCEDCEEMENEQRKEKFE